MTRREPSSLSGEEKGLLLHCSPQLLHVFLLLFLLLLLIKEAIRVVRCYDCLLAASVLAGRTLERGWCIIVTLLALCMPGA